jgi:hypothetical protein
MSTTGVNKMPATLLLLLLLLLLLQVGGAITGPFVLEAYLSCRLFSTKPCTYRLACLVGVAFAASSAFAVAVNSSSLPALACLLFVFGATQATTCGGLCTEALAYIHVARRLEQLGKHVATHVSMCMCTIAIALGAGIGNVIGGALQQQQWGWQIGVTCSLSGGAGLFAVVLSICMLRRCS